MATKPTYFNFGQSNSWFERIFDDAYAQVSSEDCSLLGLPSKLDYYERLIPSRFPVGSSHCKPHIRYGSGSLCAKCWMHVGPVVLDRPKKKYRKRRWERGR